MFTARLFSRSLSARAVPADGERIAKYIARCGSSSRREAEKLIEQGSIYMNGNLVHSCSERVRPGDTVSMDGCDLMRPLRRARLFAYHKLTGEIVSTVSPKKGIKTVFDVIESCPDNLRLHLPRLISVGRLDVTTEGLLLLSSSPALTTYLSHPESGLERIYRARVFGEIDTDKLEHLAKGTIIDGVRYRPIHVIVDRERRRNSWLQLSLTEGKNREVRNVLQWAGLAVNRLIRIRFGPFRLDNLEPGRVREILNKRVY